MQLLHGVKLSPVHSWRYNTSLSFALLGPNNKVVATSCCGLDINLVTTSKRVSPKLWLAPYSTFIITLLLLTKYSFHAKTGWDLTKCIHYMQSDKLTNELCVWKLRQYMKNMDQAHPMWKYDFDSFFPAQLVHDWKANYWALSEMWYSLRICLHSQTVLMMNSIAAFHTSQLVTCPNISHNSLILLLLLHSGRDLVKWMSDDVNELVLRSVLRM